ncbi:MAG: hypothetical protein IJ437_03725 [Clostridia bacterium]|nr:hypothetical protein [Clostridia bacterium]
MFNQENRYITCGIDENLPIELQQYLWMCIDLQTAYNEEIVDYLQVFTFEKVGTDILAITQSQEKPNQKTIHYTNYKPEYDKILAEKIFVIDDGDHSTMLFAYEY